MKGGIYLQQNGRRIEKMEFTSSAHDQRLDRHAGKIAKRSQLPALIIAVIMILSSVTVAILTMNPLQQEQSPEGNDYAGIEYYNGRNQISIGPEFALGITATDTNDIASGDLDNDGDLELVTVSYNELRIWNSTGNPWTFWDEYLAGDFAMETGISVALGDLDNDGWLDIIAGDNDANVWCWQNDHTPFESWGAPNRITTTSVIAGTAVVAIGLGDFDNDGWLDVATIDNSTNGNYLDVNQNDHTPFIGMFSGIANWALSATRGTSVALGDIDNNGWLDILTGDQSAAMIGWENDGTPWDDVWTANLLGDRSSNCSNILAVALGDLDKDGDLDPVSSENNRTVCVWENSGGINSWDAKTGHIVLNDQMANGTCIAVGDFDNDGWLDLVGGSDFEGRTGLFDNDHSPFDGDWLFTGTGMGGTTNVLGMCLGDFDLDGDVDYATAHEDNIGASIFLWENILLHRNMPLGDMGEPVLQSPYYDAALGDLDGDGDLDVITGTTINATSGELTLIENEDSPTPFLRYLEISADVHGVATGDLDNDHDVDIVCGIAEYLYVWENPGDPWLGVWNQVLVDSETSFGFYELSVGDLDNDGQLDIVVGGYGGVTPIRLRVYQNDGTPFDGGWVRNNVSSNVPIPGSIFCIDIADFDNNGSLDIVVGGNQASGDQIVAFENDNTPFVGYWASNIVGSIGIGPDAVAVEAADYDNDGDPDVAVAEKDGGNRVFMFQNDGTPFAGVWSSNFAISLGDDPNVLSAEDFDLDGDLDLAVGTGPAETYEVLIIENDGTPFSGIWTRHNVGSHDAWINALLTCRINNDAGPDIISCDHIGRLYAWENLGAQITEDVYDVSPGTFDAGTEHELLRIAVTSNGKSTDETAEMAVLRFQFYRGDGVTPLTPSEMNDSFEYYLVYKDDGDLSWNNLTDSPVPALVEFNGNEIILNVSDGTANATIDPTVTENFFLVVKLQLLATLPSFRVEYDPDFYDNATGGNVIELQPTDSALSIEEIDPVMTGVISIIAIPEFSTIMLPIVGVLAVVLLFRRISPRRRN